MDGEQLLLKIETLVDVLTSLGHHSLWFRTVNYGAPYPDLEFIVTWGNRRLAQWSAVHEAWRVTEEILCIPLNGNQTVPTGELIDKDWVFNKTLLEQLNRKSI